MAGFHSTSTETTMFADNVDFTGNALPSPQITADGQLIIGSSATPKARIGTLTAGSGISITNGHGSITIAASGSAGISTIDGDTGSVTGSTVSIKGASTAAGITPINTSGSGSAMTINVQKSQAIASADATKVGLANFDSASFAVDANGFVTLVGTSAYYSLTPYIVGSDIHSQFSTISSAITQAISDGASSTNQKNIYVKPGTYVENLTIANGINVIAMDENVAISSTFPTTQILSVKLSGNVTFTGSSGQSKIENILIEPASGVNCIEISATSMVSLIKGCIFNPSGTSSIFNCSSSGATLVVDYCSIKNLPGTHALFSNTASSILSCSISNSILISTATSTLAASSSLTLNAEYTFLTFEIDASAATTLSSSLEYCRLGTISTSKLFTDSSGTATDLTLFHCEINNNADILNINSSVGTIYFIETIFIGGTINTGTVVPIVTATDYVTGRLVQNNLNAFGVVYADATGELHNSTVGTATQVLTSNGAGVAPTFQNVTSGALAWSDGSGSFTAAATHGYFITATSTPTLPASPNEGDTISFIVDTTNICTITANTGQQIRIGVSLSASAGTAANNARGDSVTLVYRSTGTTWFSLGSPEGTWTVT